MTCESTASIDLMNKVLDGDASLDEKREFEEHVMACPSCRFEYEMLNEALNDMKDSTVSIKAPAGFTEQVMNRLPKEKRKFSVVRWLQKHPALSAAAIFVLFMTASIFTAFNQNNVAIIKGSGNLIIDRAHHKVTVPKGSVIKGDLVIENANVFIAGKVEGNVTIVKGKRYMASAGEVTGDSKEIGAVVQWVWYKLKAIFSGQASSSEPESRSHAAFFFFAIKRQG